MKYFQLTFLVFLITQNLFALTSGFNFQAVLRDAEGNILVNEDVEITISLLSLDGKEVYSETHTTKTNATGLMSLVIGEGTSDINFSDIEWSNKYDLVIKVNGEEFDPQPLNSVPYALYAENGLTSELIEAIEANIAKVGITPAQDSAIALISNKSGYYNTVTLGNSSVTDIYAAEDGEAIIHAGGITFSDGTTQTTASSSDGGSGGGTTSSNVTFNQVLTSGFTDSTTVLEIGNFTIRVKSIDNSNHYLEWKVNTGDISDYFAATVTMKGSRAADWNAMNVEPVVGNNSGIRAEDTFTEIVNRTNNYTGGESGGYLNSPGLWYYKTVEVELTNEQHNESYKITAIVNGLGKVMLKGEHWDFK